ncbi:hypothetical protein MRB53_021635 [Persea americana]|uniref:Uncharacterized protein n=1 Tax=Persea americana TaxID=3435 RepID=A0ACC2L4Y3_PERAE|nr:hypothetical protein MRB53_021635 [Persea americana]
MEFPPGFRFCPLSWELIQYYVKNKNDGVPLPIQIPVADIYECHPERLPGSTLSLSALEPILSFRSALKIWENFKYAINNEKYYFTRRQYKDPRGSRVKRSTDGGYWKTTSKDIEITDGENNKIGYLKKFKFMKGKGRNPTNWIMHEYRDLDTDSAMEETTSIANSSRICRYVMCKIYKVGKDPINSPSPIEAIEYTETEIEFEGSISIPQNHRMSINGYHPHQTSSQNMNQFYEKEVQNNLSTLPTGNIELNNYDGNEVEESSIPHTIPISSQFNEGGCLGGMHPNDSIDNLLEFFTSDELLDYDADENTSSIFPNSLIESQQYQTSALLLNMNQFQAQSHEINLQHNQFAEEGLFIFTTGISVDFHESSLFQQIVDYDMDDMQLDPRNIMIDPG